MECVNSGCIRPLVDLIKFPEKEVQLAALLALNSIALGLESMTKSFIMSEHGLEPIIELTGHVDYEISSSAIYVLGSLAEHEEVKSRLVELGSIGAAVKQMTIGDLEVKRAAGYFISSVAEMIDLHPYMEKEGALPAIIDMALMEDIECQEYAAFALAHLSSNRDYQVPLVKLGAVRPLVAMLASDAEPKHYAGLALLKLADNFENHLRIAEEGGIQALLRLGRTRSSDEQLQYKTALTVGQLASNAVRLLPTKAGGATGVIGHGSKMMEKLRTQVNAQKAKANVMENLEDFSRRMTIDEQTFYVVLIE
jgi:hypothetical protein